MISEFKNEATAWKALQQLNTGPKSTDDYNHW